MKLRLKIDLVSYLAWAEVLVNMITRTCFYKLIRKIQFDFSINRLKFCSNRTLILIIIMSCHQHRYPWSSFATSPYRPLLSAGLLSYIPYLHWVAVCRFELVVLPLLVHVKGFTRVHLLLQLCPACLVRLILIIFVMGGRWCYSCCFVGCCLQDLFNITRSISG